MANQNLVYLPRKLGRDAIFRCKLTIESRYKEIAEKIHHYLNNDERALFFEQSPFEPEDLPDGDVFGTRHFAGKSKIGLNDLEAKISVQVQNETGIDVEKLKMASLYFCCAVFGEGTKKKTIKINPKYLRLVDDLNRFNTYPWGRIAYRVAVRCLKKDLLGRYTHLTEAHGRKEVDGTFLVGGFVLPMQILAYECYPSVAQRFAKRRDMNGLMLPRMFQWVTNTWPSNHAPSAVDVSAAFGDCAIDDCLGCLIPTPEELISPYYTTGVFVDSAPDAVITRVLELWRQGQTVICSEHPLESPSIRHTSLSPDGSSTRSAHATRSSSSTGSPICTGPRVHFGLNPSRCPSPLEHRFERQLTALEDSVMSLRLEMRAGFIETRASIRHIDMAFDELRSSLTEQIRAGFAEIRSHTPGVAEIRSSTPVREDRYYSIAYSRRRKRKSSETDFGVDDNMAREIGNSSQEHPQPIFEPDLPTIIEESSEDIQVTPDAVMSGGEATTSRDLFQKGRKRIKLNEGIGYNDSTFIASWRFESEQKRKKSCSKLSDYSDPLWSNCWLEELESGKFGSVTNDIKELLARRKKLLDSHYGEDSSLPYRCSDVQSKMVPRTTETAEPDVIDLDDNQEDESNALVQKFATSVQPPHLAGPVVIIDLDDDNGVRSENSTSPYMEVNLNPSGKLLIKDFVEQNFSRRQSSGVGNVCMSGKTQSLEGKKASISGTDDDMEMDESSEMSDTNSDGLGGIWNEMTVALECSKKVNEVPDEYEAEGEIECLHNLILKDDIGDVCRICGVIKRGIETIIEYNFSKSTRSTRTHHYEGRTSRDIEEVFPDGFKPSGCDFTAAEIYPHPRHKKEMKPHQVEGFNFLVSNLVVENPGGCIMAHAPGSGKTFMIISFLQSFMAKYPSARPLVVLPRGILAIWKKEFIRWQVEDIPLYDFYSVKADSRAQQLEVLKQWSEVRSILFLGYKQFSSIVCDTDNGKTAVACQEILLLCPSILILDEGHTPRNQDTDVLTSLERVQTQRKVVLSGTLYQNHVKEVFNILNLVRPRFLKMETSKAVKRRILGRAEISTRRNLMKSGRENEFYELIEHTLLKDENYTRKVTVIQDLREMTKKVLHYYKGDNLDELPGLVDFSVFLHLSPWQQKEVKELTKLGRKFTINAQGSAIYAHPKLKALSQNSGVKDRIDEGKIDTILEKLDVREGVKSKFYLNLLQLCASNGEKLLVFSQYLLPLKFLERLTSKMKGYRIGIEMFMITGDSDVETRESYMEKFNTSADAKVFFGSIKACGEGISLVGASRIIIFDVHLNPSVTRQAIGRAFRPGQVRKVYTYRLIASGSPEEADHTTCFRKESVAKLWFEWDEFNGCQNLEMETVNVNDCGDLFLEMERLNEDVTAVFKR
ncbi:protein CHROMATIN REMODELING 35-like isoform X2 [Primulina eburnea]|uniref:protein CHROMATIN REMODELING 35-like isoform X2 n=1 Tax=Primulina eburnea TaxID=1245227 RepID=UPI003C6CA323